MSDPKKRRGGEEGGVATVTKTEKKTERPKLYKVLLHNDDYTTMEFVVAILIQVFHHPEQAAVEIMLHVHRNGLGVAGIFTYEVAETKVKKVASLAEEAGFPLLCTMERE
jgi:ATP-dependent Clp protease adaptor protein ClpS